MYPFWVSFKVCLGFFQEDGRTADPHRHSCRQPRGYTGVLSSPYLMFSGPAFKPPTGQGESVCGGVCGGKILRAETAPFFAYR